MIIRSCASCIQTSTNLILNLIGDGANKSGNTVYQIGCINIMALHVACLYYVHVCSTDSMLVQTAKKYLTAIRAEMQQTVHMLCLHGRPLTPSGFTYNVLV